MSALRDTIARRVDALRALALDRAATTGEAAAAAELADRLALKYGLDETRRPALADPLSVPAVPVVPDDLDPHGTWGGRRAPVAGSVVTAALMGDPAPARSALAQRRGRA